MGDKVTPTISTQRKSPWHQECEFHLANSHLPLSPPFQKLMDKNYYRLSVPVFTDLVTTQLHILHDWRCTPISALVMSPLLLFIPGETCAAVGTQEMLGRHVLTQPLAKATLPDLVRSHRWLGWEERWQNHKTSGVWVLLISPAAAAKLKDQRLTPGLTGLGAQGATIARKNSALETLIAASGQSWCKF